MKDRERITAVFSENLEEEKDYDIVSHYVLDKNDKFHTIESFLGIDQLEFINKCKYQQEIKAKLLMHVIHELDRRDFKKIKKTEMIKKPVYFYRLNDIPLNLDILFPKFGLVRNDDEGIVRELLFYDMLYFRNFLQDRSRKGRCFNR